MKTNEVEKKLGLSKQTLFFYESEGLVDIQRDENGYRNYSEEDLQKLHLIKFLRNLDISLDDIILILAGKLSFNEIMSLKSNEINNTIDDKTELLEVVDTLKKRKVPLIPALATLENNLTRYPLSFWKSTDTVSMGRRLTKKLLIKWLWIYTFYSFILTISIYIGVQKKTGISLNFLSLTLIFILVLCFILFLMISNLLPSGSPIQSSRLKFVEFVEEGIYFYQPKGFSENLEYILSVVKGKDILSFQKYEAIDYVKIVKHKRYMKSYGFSSYAPPLNVNSFDFLFSFKNHDDIYLYAPLILNNDSEIIAHILLEKVTHIDDREEYLQSFLTKNKEYHPID